MAEPRPDSGAGEGARATGRRGFVGNGFLVATAGALGGVLGSAGDAHAKEAGPRLQFGRAVVPAGTSEVTVQGLTLTPQSIGLATSQSSQGTSCWVALDVTRGTLTITMMAIVEADTPVGYLVVG